MQVFSTILGNADMPEIGRQLHRLEHQDLLDEVVLAQTDLARRRMRILTRKGRSIGIALPRDTRLCDGDVLRLGSDGALVVRVDAQRWLRLRPTGAAAALRVGYHAGNLHWRVRFDGSDILIGLEGAKDPYLDRLRDLEAEGALAIVGEEARG